MVRLGDSKHVVRDLVFSRYGLALTLILAAAVYGLVQFFERFGTTTGLAAVSIAAALMIGGFLCICRFLRNAKPPYETDE